MLVGGWSREYFWEVTHDQASLPLLSSLSKEWNPQKQKTINDLLGQPTLEQVIKEYILSQVFAN